MAELFKYFVPEKDITAYELAYIMSHLSLMTPPRWGVHIAEDAWRVMPQNIKRHFVMERPRE